MKAHETVLALCEKWAIERYLEDTGPYVYQTDTTPKV
jgi:hypothetical protein